MWVSYENWMHIAGNSYGAWLDHHPVSIGTDHGMTFCMSGTSAKATVGMQWLQNMVAQIFDGILEICKLYRFVA